MLQLYYFKYVQLILHLCWISGTVSSQDLNTGRTEANVGPSYFFYQRPDYPRDCTEATNGCVNNNESGVYLIKPDGYPEPFEVYCDNTEDSGGWTVIHRLHDGSLCFNRNWTEYKIGFGFLSQEFWLGNEKLSFLTNQKTYELRIDVTSTDGLSFCVTYNKFRISDEYSGYNLTSVGEYSGSEDNITMLLCPSGSEGVVYISSDCSRRCSCASGQFLCDNYQCSTNAVCEERNDVLQCYCNAGYIGDGVNCTAEITATDCQDVYDTVSNKSGVYKIKPTTSQGEIFDVYCNMTDGVGWTVFQRRIDGSQDFNLNWTDYQNGFGTLDQEHWLGNEKLYSLTAQKTYELRIDFVNRNHAPYYAKYSSFEISDKRDNYRLSLGSYSGNAGNSLSYHNGYAFSTRDRDNDIWSSGNCVNDVDNTYCDGGRCNFRGAWWFKNCATSSLNSPYDSNCFYWRSLPGSGCYMKYVEMKIRPI